MLCLQDTGEQLIFHHPVGDLYFFIKICSKLVENRIPQKAERYINTKSEAVIVLVNQISDHLLSLNMNDYSYLIKKVLPYSKFEKQYREEPPLLSGDPKRFFGIFDRYLTIEDLLIFCPFSRRSLYDNTIITEKGVLIHKNFSAKIPTKCVFGTKSQFYYDIGGYRDFRSTIDNNPLMEILGYREIENDFCLSEQTEQPFTLSDKVIRSRMGINPADYGLEYQYFFYLSWFVSYSGSSLSLRDFNDLSSFRVMKRINQLELPLGRDYTDPGIPDIIRWKKLYNVYLFSDFDHFGNDYSWMTFTNRTVENKDFKKEYFVGTNFKNIHFVNCNFIKCYFSLTEFDNCRFSSCQFEGCYFRQVKGLPI